MKKSILFILVLVLFGPEARAQFFSSEGTWGAVLGALAGQAIGHDTEATLIGAGTGLAFGTLMGMDHRQRGYVPRSYSGRPYYPSHRYSTHRPHYTQTYGTQHYCPQPRVIRQVAERPVYVQSNRGHCRSTYYPEQSYAYYPQPTVLQQPIVIQQSTVFQTQPVIVSQPVIIHYIPQISVVPQCGYRVTY